MTADLARPADRDPGRGADPLAVFDPAARTALTAVAGLLVPAAHGMPSAADVVGDARLRFVLTARPDLLEPLRAALLPGIGDDAATRLAALERDDPDAYQALISTVVFGYYTDKGTRDLLGYPGQMAKEIHSWKLPEYIEEGLTDQVLARGPVWRDPATGRRAEPPSATDASSR